MRKHLLTVIAIAAVALPALAWSEPPDPAARQAAVEATFKEADANGDGVLSPEEFVRFGQLMRENRAARRFARLDADGSGGVTLAELEAAKGRRGHCH